MLFSYKVKKEIFSLFFCAQSKNLRSFFFWTCIIFKMILIMFAVCVPKLYSFICYNWYYINLCMYVHVSHDIVDRVLTACLQFISYFYLKIALFFLSLNEFVLSWVSSAFITCVLEREMTGRKKKIYWLWLLVFL